MKAIIYDQGAGLPAAIAYPSDKLIAEIGIGGCVAKLLPTGAAYQVVEDTNIPTDRTFRDAWQIQGSTLEVAMPKAKAIHRDRLRQMRAPLLVASDVEFIRAIETSNLPLQAQIAAKKQALRDVTTDPAIAAARTPEELKAAIPAVLRG